jgi:AraC-like DNA-binding protein
MTYVAARPHPALRGVVEGYAGYDEVATTPCRRRQAPWGGMTMILAWDGPLLLAGPDGTAPRGAFLAGMHDAVVLTSFTGRQQGVQVDLTPLGTTRLLSRPAAELTDRVAVLAELDVPALTRLPDRLAATEGWPARFALVDATLRALLEASRMEPDPAVRHAWARLSGAAGRVPVADLAEELGWSRRHLLTRFRRQVGLAPTAAGRVLRFRHAARMLVPGAGPDRLPSTARVADVAATCGFADHSHLVREFRALAGCTPTRFVAEWTGSPVVFPDVQDDAPGAS